MPESAACSWQQLRAQYVGSPTLSLRELAAARRVSYDALKRRARREGWAVERAANVCTARRRRDLEELARARCLDGAAYLRSLAGRIEVLARSEDPAAAAMLLASGISDARDDARQARSLLRQMGRT